MAGGGLKVAFQAGVLQVWLDEARSAGRPLEFRQRRRGQRRGLQPRDVVPGMTGRQIADNWRRFAPVRHGLAVDLRGWARGASLLSMSRFAAAPCGRAGGWTGSASRPAGARRGSTCSTCTSSSW
jgi:hypothetical protein